MPTVNVGVATVVDSRVGARRVISQLIPVVACAAGVALAASLAHASDDRHKWWLSSRVKAEIGLTDQQSRDIEAIFQAMVPRLRAEKEELDRQEGLLAAVMKDDTADEASVTQAIERVERARGAMSKTRTLMLFRMNRVLSADQRVKLAAYREQRERERRSSGPTPPSRHR